MRTAQVGSYRLILASGSAARRDLLSRAGLQFQVVPADIDEPTDAGFADGRSYVQHVAWLKAKAVASQVPGDSKQPTVVLAADTVGWLHGRAIGKPVDEADARRILRLLAGTEHELWTGVCVWRRPGDVQLSWQEMTRVAMRAMSETELAEYLRTRQWEGCSGAYAILENHDPYVQVVDGSISNVIGLPMETLTQVLEWFPCR
jgi:septum formation protein